MRLDYDQNQKERTHKRFWENFRPEMLRHTRLYWDHYSQRLTIYPNRKTTDIWLNGAFEEQLKLFQEVIDNVIEVIKTC